MPKSIDTIKAPAKEEIVESVNSTNIEIPKKEKKVSKKDKKTKPKKIKKVKDKVVPVNKEVVKAEKKSHKKTFIVISIILGFILFLIAGSVAGIVAHEKIYTNKVFPGVTVWGEDMGGKTFEEVSEIVGKKVFSTRLKLVGPDQEYEANLTDLGVVVDTESMSLSAYTMGRSEEKSKDYLVRARLFVASWGFEPLSKFVKDGDLLISPSYYVDDQILDAYLNKISENINIAPKDSQVTVAGGNINVVPALYGREVLKDVLKENLLSEVENFESKEIRIQTKELVPAVVDKAAEEVKIQTESVISRPVTLNFDGQVYKPNKETVASWISYTKKEGSPTYDLVVDPAKMKNYFSFLGTKINIYPIEKKVRVENGVKETVIQEGVDGRLIDEKVLGQKISQLLPTQASVDLTIPTYVATFKTKYEQVVVADWEKYIDINLTTQTMTAYLKGGQVVGSWLVTTGKDSTPTPVGTWLVHGKTASTLMKGGTPGIDYYYLPNVEYVTWFKGGGYAIHEAYWRSVFGGQDYHWAGSHGCVNAPESVAKFIYDWAPIGTPVIVHY